MSELHVGLGVAVVAANALAGGWGGVAWLRKDPSRVFWVLLRAAQVVTVVQVLVGFALYSTGSRPDDELHYVYGVAPLVVAFASEAMRVGAAQRELADVGDVHAMEESEQLSLARRVLLREMGIMAVGALLILTLALRAAVTSGGL